jgi:hypothetical protein
MLLSQTLFSIGLFVPLSTLSLKLFMDAFQFISLLQTKLNKIEIIRQLQMILFQKKNVKFLISNQQLCKIFGFKKDYQEMNGGPVPVLSGMKVENLQEGSRGNVNYVKLFLKKEKPILLLH